MSKAALFPSSLIEQCDANIEIRSEAYPREVGDEEPCGDGDEFTEVECGHDDGGEERQDDDCGDPWQVQAEEDNRPQCVERQLHAEPDVGGLLARGLTCDKQAERDTHQDI